MEYLSLKKAKEILDKKSKPLSVGYLRYLIRKGELKAMRIGTEWFTNKDWLEEFLRITNKNELRIRDKKEKIELTPFLQRDDVQPKIVLAKSPVVKNFKVKNGVLEKITEKPLLSDNRKTKNCSAVAKMQPESRNQEIIARGRKGSGRKKGRVPIFRQGNLEVEKIKLVLPLFFHWGLALVKIRKTVLQPFRKWWQEAVALILLTGIIIGGIFFYRLKTAQGLTYVWTQLDWSGGVSANYPRHEENNDGWTKYSNASASVDIPDPEDPEKYVALFTYPAAPGIEGSLLPEPGRKDLAAAHDRNNNLIFLFGGYSQVETPGDTENDVSYSNQIIQYNPSNNQVTTDGIGTLLVHLRGHSAVYNENDGKIYIFGGYHYEAEDNKGFNDKIYVFDPDNKLAGAQDTGDVLSEGISDTAAVYYNQNIYVFGGFYLTDAPNLTPTYSNKIYRYTPATHTVSQVTTFPSITGLRGHSAVRSGTDNMIYILGGYSGAAYSTTIYKYNPASPTTPPTTVSYSGTFTGRVYAPALYSSALGVQRIYIFGGMYLEEGNLTAQYLNQVVAFDPAARTVTAQTETLPAQMAGMAITYNTLDDVISIFGGYKNNPGPGESHFSRYIYYYPFMGILFSSQFNMTDDTAMVSKLEWDEDLPSGTYLGFQMRTATNNDNGTPFDPSDDAPVTWTDWMGPDGTSNSYFNSSNCTPVSGHVACGDTDIPIALRDWTNDHWVQYKFLMTTDSLSATPKVVGGTGKGVKVTYVINTPPVVSSVTASQDNSGIVNVAYTSEDEDVPQDTLSISLLYDAGLTLSSALSLDGGTVSVNDPNEVMSLLTTTNTLQIESEQISCTGKTVDTQNHTGTFTGCSRGNTTSTGYYKKAHDQDLAVWVKANSITCKANGTPENCASNSAGSNKTITWNAKTDIDGFYVSAGDANPFKIKVNANDGNLARNVGHSDSSAFEFDTKDPVLTATSINDPGGQTGFTVYDTELGVDMESTDYNSTYRFSTTNNQTISADIASTDDTELRVYLQDITSGSWSPPNLINWDSYTTYAKPNETKTFTFATAVNQTKTVEIRIRDKYGNYQDITRTIDLDTAAPTANQTLYIQDISNIDAGTIRLFTSWAVASESDFWEYQIFRSPDNQNYTRQIQIEKYSVNPTTITQAKNTNFYVDTSGLSEGSTYYYKFKTFDTIGNDSGYSQVVSITAGGNPTDNTPPPISNVQESEIGNYSIKISWSTNGSANGEPGTTSVIYSTNSSIPDGSPSQGVSGYRTSHEVVLTGLDHSTTYYYKVRSCDAAGNCGEYPSSAPYGDFTTTTPDTNPLVISVTSTDADTSSFTINWNTTSSGQPKEADSFIEYSTQPGPANSVLHGKNELVTSHSVTVPGLSSGITYYYKVHSTDSSDNEGTTTEASITTDALQEDNDGPGINESTIAADSDDNCHYAVISWNNVTDEPSTSFVEYGEDANYGKIYGSLDLVQNTHSVELPHDLEGSTTYHYKVRSRDANNNESESGTDKTFTTLDCPADPTPPVITNVHVVGQPGPSNATIAWTTDEESDSFVDYDTESDQYRYSQGTTVMDQTPSEHEVTLIGLQPSIEYYYRARSKNQADKTATKTTDDEGATLTFVTATSSSNTPEINDGSVTATVLDCHRVRVDWNVNSDPSVTSIVEYGFNDSYGSAHGSLALTQNPHSVTLLNLLQGATYHYRARSKNSDDLEDPSIDKQFITPDCPDTTPPDITAGPTANSITINSATISWTTDGPANALVDYGTSKPALGLIAGDATDYTSSTHNVALSNLASGTKYYYRIRSQDESGNWRTDDNSGSYYDFTTTAHTPLITNLAVPVRDQHSATITWDTDEDAKSQVEYSLNEDLSDSTLTTEITDLRNKHSVIILSLTANTTYYFRAISRNSAGTTGYSSTSNFTTYSETGEDITPPVFETNPAATTTETTATIIWTTDEPASSIVDYGLTSQLGSIAGSAVVSGTDHSVTITGLTQNTTYYYQARTIDTKGNAAIYPPVGQSRATFTTQHHITPPVISDVHTSVISSDGATITWTTNELATSQVEYGKTDNYGSQTTKDTNLTTSHTVYLTNLQIQTTYHYKVVSEDAAGNEAESADYNFATTREPGEVSAGGGGGGYMDTVPPNIYDVVVTDVTNKSAVISWKTNEDASSLIEYGKTSTYTNLAGNHDEKKMTHEIKLEELFSGTTYHFKAVSYDKYGNKGYFQDQTFTTTGKAEEKPTEEIPPEEEKPEEEKPEEKLPKEEKDLLEKIKQASSAFISQLFKVLPANPNVSKIEEEALLGSISEMAEKMITPPFIAGEYPVVEVGPNWAKIYWVTDKKANSLVAYASEKEYDANKEEPYAGIGGNVDEEVIEHIVELKNLEPATIYHYQARSKAKLGDWSKSKDKTFMTLSLLPEITEVQFTSISEKSAILTWKTSMPAKSIIEITDVDTGEKSLREDKSFLKEHIFEIKDLFVSTDYALQVTAEDEAGRTKTSSVMPFSTTLSKNPPIISNMRITTSLIPGKTEKVQTIVIWKTDKPATTRIFYEQGISSKTELAESTQLDKKMVTDHTVITTGLKPGTVYRLRAESTDALGNRGVSQDYTLLTPKPKASLIDLIIKNFEDTFSFMKKVKF